jgi:hypothetical protein
MADVTTAIEVWREFFVVSAGATAVLLGLTFVGLTLHVERESLNGNRRGLALVSGTSLVYALLASLAMLIPEGEPYVQAAILIVAGWLGLFSSLYAFRQVQREPGQRLSNLPMLLQFGLPVIATAAILASGIGLAVSWTPGVWGVGAVVFLLLVDGIQSAWDLLRIGFV